MNETLGSHEMEQSRERKVIVIGRPKDLGIGNPDGIPSTLADATDEELRQIAEQDNELLVEPNDMSCTACIDGRACLHNADNSEPKIRLRRVGGSASNFGVALNAEAPLVTALPPDASLGDQIMAVDEFMGYRSAHLGGCGGAGGEIQDNELIANKPQILSAVKALMSVPEVRKYLGVDYDDMLAERVRTNAAKTAQYLVQAGWDGQAYVDGVVATDPGNVENLQTDPDDHLFHGHKEAKTTIIIGDLTSRQNDEFVWNLKASKQVAEKMSGERGVEGYTQALIAEVAKHMAVVERLSSGETPIILQVV